LTGDPTASGAHAPAAADRPAAPPRRGLYRATLGVALAVAAMAAFFFVVGLADGSVSSFNIGLWLVLLGGLAGVLWTGIALRARGRTGAALAVLGIVAVPGLLAVFFLLVVVITQPRWN
jgi:apolipoprotein N-acyltransferase